MDRDQLLEMRAKVQQEYADSWAVTAQHNESLGAYDWMSGFLKGYKRILEIGVGDGISTSTLLKQDSVLISVDSNIVCLLRAQHRLGGEEKFQILSRLRWVEEADALTATFSTINLPPPTQGALLVEGEFTNDPELEKWLDRCSPFDAIICWLIGTNSVDLLRCQANPGEYRLRVQNQVYEVANRLLRPNGVLHFVDRIKLIDDSNLSETKSTIIESHSDQARFTSLDVDPESFCHRTWSNPENGMGMVVKGSFSKDPAQSLYSIFARRR
jgi:hypothetical protein